jgi:hypothetical protein
MPPVTTMRPPTEEEQVLLAEPPPKLFGWFTGIVSSACIFALVFLVALLASPALPLGAVLPVAVVTAIIASLASYTHVQRRHRRALRQMAEQSAREAGAGHVRSTTYTITDAVAVEEAEDEGLSYYLLLDDGRTLFLSGQYLYQPAESGFPWTSFEIVQTPVRRDVLRVVPRGPRLAPSRTRGPFSDREYQSGTVPDDGSIEARDFNALKSGAV